MKESHKILIGATRQQYLATVSTLRGSAGPQEAFAAWILGPKYQETFDLGEAIHAASIASAASRTYNEVAVLGYAASIAKDLTTIGNPLDAGLEWLIGRTPFTQDPPTFEVDGTSLLGFALGAKAIEKNPVNGWMANFLKRSVEMRLSLWDKCLIAAAASLADCSTLVPVPSEIDVADLRVALVSRDVAGMEVPDDCQHAMCQVLDGSYDVRDAVRAAARLRVLDWLSYETSLLTKERLTVEDVCQLLERVQVSMKRWRWDENTKWTITNEYHVQDLLWVILAPLFPDLEDEENLPSLGHKHPRYDLGIPSLHLIVEVKFIRRGSQASFAKIIEEIAADHSLYISSGSRYKKIIAFVWDDSASTEQHGELKQGLLKMPGIAGAVIVARPAKMAKQP